ncbi:NAD(P)H dehydrogenase (quinone) [Ranunculus cassubicifolius]
MHIFRKYAHPAKYSGSATDAGTRDPIRGDSWKDVCTTKERCTNHLSTHDLAEADGFIFGFPTRFGMMAAQMKAFIDSTGVLWRTQGLAGKPAGIFYITGSQGAGMFEMDEAKGGSPYAAGTYAGDGTRQPTALELTTAFHHGKYIAGITKNLKASYSVAFYASIFIVIFLQFEK